MKDKKKIFVRILCGILVAIMTLGLVIPYVMASEIEDIVEPEVSNSAEIAIPEGNLPESIEELGSGTEDEIEFSDSDFPIPFEKVPDGFEYVISENNTPLLIKEDNGNTGFMISDLPDGYDCSVISLFIGNLETQEISVLNLTSEDYYLGQIDLWDGYYVVFSNNYAFCNSDGVGYAVNGGENLYFHVGSEFDAEKYPVEFVTVVDNTEMFKLHLSAAPDYFQKVSATTTLDVDASKIEFPEDVRINVLGVVDEPAVEDGIVEGQPIPEEEIAKPTAPDESNGDDGEEKKEYTWYGTLFSVIKKNAFLIIAIAGCYIGTVVIKIKKKRELERQAENDKYDEGLIE